MPNPEAPETPVYSPHRRGWPDQLIVYLAFLALLWLVYDARSHNQELQHLILQNPSCNHSSEAAPSRVVVQLEKESPQNERPTEKSGSCCCNACTVTAPETAAAARTAAAKTGP